ncbi:restriction endonuclease subunit S [Psychroflexus salis]|uniref:Type I restriction modification DNA specificity domain-containing protein n=1 Tax=Psychroflexus salis TaxID=1526574 RepID=A0A916ZNX3_9FLAO|nr:restriction endonuclease subunit S [Psychroflexus salis]GGE06924.1 hypothetical protein GCM10010831_05520 [Psychroflexus salis]
MKSSTETNVPELRFPEFEGEWEKVRFDKLFKITAGGDIKKQHVSETKTEKYSFPIYANAEKNKGLYGYSDKYKIENDAITVAGRGANFGIAHARNKKFYPIVRLLVLIPLKTQNVIFFEYCINKMNFFKESTGVPQLTSPQISSYKIIFPQLPEQQKIADFLSQVDRKIDLLQQKVAALAQYKKGVMQQLFSQEVRFKRGLSGVEGQDDGSDFPDWEVKKLGEVLCYNQPTKYIVKSTEYNDSYKTPVLTAGKTFILGFTNEIENTFTDLPVIIFDDFTLANHYVDFDFKVKSSAMKILSASSKDVNIKFIYESMQMIKFSKGEEHKRFWISVYSKLKIQYPCPDEQTKIANFLSSIDQKIAHTQEQLEQTQNFKKGLLQKMFV